MALQKQAVPINFAKGLETKSDPFQIEPGKFLELQNSVFNRSPRLQKRNGFEALATTVYNPYTVSNSILGSNVTEGRLSTKFNDELLINDAFNLYSFSESKSAWAYKGRSTMVGVTENSIATSINDQTMADSAINSTLGQTLYAWSDSEKGLMYSVFDNETGQNLTGQVLAAANGLRARCLSLGSNLYLFYITGGSLFGIRITASGAAAPITVVSDLNSTFPNYDAEIIGTAIYIAYAGNSSNIWVRLLNSALTVSASVSKSEDATACISLFGDTSNNVWVSYGNGSSGVKVFVEDSTLITTLLAPTVVDPVTPYNVTGTFAQSKAYLFYDILEVPLPGGRIDYYTSSVDPAFVQPAVNGTIVVPFVNATADRIGEIVYLLGDLSENPNYYRITAATADTNYTLLNLGYAGNTAPGGTVHAEHTGSIYAFVLFATNFANSYIKTNTVTLAGVVGTPVEFARSVALVSKAFTQDNIPHVTALHPASLQPTYFLLNLYNTYGTIGVNLYANIAAKISASVAGTIPEFPMLARINQIGDLVSLALLRKTILFTSAGQQNVIGEPATPNVYTQTGVSKVGFDFSLSNPDAMVLGQNLHITSGEVIMYDGSNVVEHGFHLYPENVTVTETATAGNLSAGTYGYQVVYEWRDDKGQVHRSAPSIVASAVVAANSSLDLEIPYLSMTNKQGVSIVIYRTAVNESVYYRITSPVAPIPNVTAGVNSFTYTDKDADSFIIGNEQLYTLGEVENIAAPSPKLIANYKNRLIEVPSEEASSFWYSKQVIPGSPVEFSDVFVQNVGNNDGEITAISAMDDKLIIYYPTSIYYMIGTGPAASGANNDFTFPLLITTDCGAVDKTTIVSMPFGHMFKSSKGIYLLDRSLQAKYVGNDVERYNDLDVVSAKLRDKENQVLFLLSNGTTLMYDYFFDQWSVFTNTPGVSDVIYKSLYCYLAADGVLYRETPDEYLDGTSPVLMYFKTGWLNFGGLQGYERMYFFYLLAKYISPHSMTIGIAFDYDETVVQTVTIDPDSSESIEQWRVFLDRQKCEAFQITLQEVYGGTPGAGFTLSGLDLQIGIKDSKPKLKAARSVG